MCDICSKLTTKIPGINCQLSCNKNQLPRFYIMITLSLNVLTHFSAVLHFIQNQSFDLQYKSIDWFLYEMQHWAEMGSCNLRRHFPHVTSSSMKEVCGLSKKDWHKMLP